MSSKEQAVAFIQTINAIQPYVPPIMFNAVLNSHFVQMALAVANENVVIRVEPKPVPPNEQKKQGQ